MSEPAPVGMPKTTWLQQSADLHRAVACANACAGMADPAAEIAMLREVAREQHAWEEAMERLGLPLKPAGAEAEIAELREAVRLLVKAEYYRHKHRHYHPSSIEASWLDKSDEVNDAAKKLKVIQYVMAEAKAEVEAQGKAIDNE